MVLRGRGGGDGNTYRNKVVKKLVFATTWKLGSIPLCGTVSMHFLLTTTSKRKNG